MNRQVILEKYRQACQSKGGITLGKLQFYNATGVKESDWIYYWPRISELQKEAGFSPNVFEQPHSEDFLLEKWASVIERLGKYPSGAELRIEIRRSKNLPSDSTLRRLGSKVEIIRKVAEHCRGRGAYKVALQVCEKLLQNQPEISSDDSGNQSQAIKTGYVYLLKLTGTKYKIGRTDNLDRRLDQHRRLLPNLKYVWKIETDDSSGVEAYWKNRFHDKLEPKSDETFNLTKEDVAAFKRWIRIV